MGGVARIGTPLIDLATGEMSALLRCRGLTVGVIGDSACAAATAQRRKRHAPDRRRGTYNFFETTGE
jgi:hypothetical protein